MIRALVVVALVGCGGARPAPPPTAAAPPDAAPAPVVDTGQCTEDGVTYADGADMPIGDNCNTCKCSHGHRSTCTVTICDVQIVDRVEFTAGSAQLQAQADPILDAVAAVLGAHPELTLTLVGHASMTEPDPIALSLARAQAVQVALIARGVDPAQLAIDGRGAAQPLGGAVDDDRRVDFVPSPG